MVSVQLRRNARLLAAQRVPRVLAADPISRYLQHRRDRADSAHAAGPGGKRPRAIRSHARRRGLRPADEHRGRDGEQLLFRSRA